MPLPSLENIRVGIIALGYVGLPLAGIVAFGAERIEELLIVCGLLYGIKCILPARTGKVRV